MGQLTRSILIDSPADDVWEIVADRFDRIGEWATAIPSSTACPVAAPTTDAPVPGRTCHTSVALVPAVTETIVAFDNAGRTLTYMVTAGLPAFVSSARNTWRVVAIGHRRSEVSFRGEVQVRGLTGSVALWFLLWQVGRTGRHLLADLKHYAEHGTLSGRKLRQMTRHG